MTTARERGYRPWRRYIRGQEPKPSDGIIEPLGVARRETIIASLQVVMRELDNLKLTRVEIREITDRANRLRRLLGWPAL
jgi:hypothetical protein